MNVEKNLQDYFSDTCAFDSVCKRWYLKDSKASGRTKYVTAAQVYSSYVTAISVLKKTCSTTLHDFEEWVETVTPQSVGPKIYFQDLPQVSNWIYEQLSSPTCPFNISNRFDMIDYCSGSEAIATSDKTVVGWLNCKAAELGKSKVYKVGLVASGWDMLKLKMGTECVKLLKESISFDANCTNVMDKFIKEIYDYLDIKEDFEIFEMLFKHWCWTLKRHIWNKSVSWQIWINFYGAQGIGKSEMIRRMFKFIRDFMAETSLNAFNDVERQFKLFTDTYVLYFDELNKGDNKDVAVEMTLNNNAVDSIKDMMTKDIITVRQYQTQDQSKFKNQFTPISAANNHLYDIVYDGEAMRRWFDFTCQRENPPESYDNINALLATFQEALKGIDENNDLGYWDQQSDIGRKIRAIQKTYVPTNTSTNSWINYCGVTPDKMHNPNNKFTIDMYSQYKIYTKSVGKFSASMERVIAIMKRIWPEAIDDEGNVYINIGTYFTDDKAISQINATSHDKKKEMLDKVDINDFV